MSEEKKVKLKPAFDNLEDSFNLWWKSIKNIVDIYLWAIFYSAIPIFLLIFLPIFKDNNIVLSALFSVILAVSLLVFVYFSIRAYIAVILLLKKEFKGENKELFKESKKYVWPYIGLSILTAILVILWSLLLIIPGIIYSVFYSLAVMTFFFEDKRGMNALKRSKELVKGYFWPVFGRLFLIFVVMTMISSIISMPLEYLEENSLGFGIWNFITQLVSLLVGPVALFYSYEIYKDLKKIKA